MPLSEHIPDLLSNQTSKRTKKELRTYKKEKKREKNKKENEKEKKAYISGFMADTHAFGGSLRERTLCESSQGLVRSLCPFFCKLTSKGVEVRRSSGWIIAQWNCEKGLYSCEGSCLRGIYRVSRLWPKGWAVELENRSVIKFASSFSCLFVFADFFIRTLLWCG